MRQMPSNVIVIISISSAPKPAVSACRELDKENPLNMPSSLPDCIAQLDRRARRRILAVKSLELRVNLRIFGENHARHVKKCLADNRKKLARAFGGVRIDGQVFLDLDAPAEIVVGGAEGARPRLPGHPLVQGRKAVRVTVQHVQLVRKLVDLSLIHISE